MRGQQERTGPLFSYISTEERIPASHPLRQVRRMADQALDRLKAEARVPGIGVIPWGPQPRRSRG